MVGKYGIRKGITIKTHRRKKFLWGYNTYKRIDNAGIVRRILPDIVILASLQIGKLPGNGAHPLDMGDDFHIQVIDLCLVTLQYLFLIP